MKDIVRSSQFYQQMGFKEEFSLPGADGQIILSVLHFGASTLLLGSLEELHYENPKRKELIQKSILGLGVVIALTVLDLNKVYKAVKKNDLTILLEPVDEYYGDRVFMFLDEHGYEWKISQVIRQVSLNEIKKVASGS